MRLGLRLLASVLALAPMGASALTKLCVEDHSTGFNWNGQEWVPANYTPMTYVVREVRPEDGFEEICQRLLSSVPYPVVPDFTTDGNGTSAGCFALGQVGAAIMDYDINGRSLFWKGGDVAYVACTNSGSTRYAAVPSGEFVATRTLSVLFGAVFDEDLPTERGSLTLSVGKCSVIESWPAPYAASAMGTRPSILFARASMRLPWRASRFVSSRMMRGHIGDGRRVSQRFTPPLARRTKG
ncbi:MAG: hypothetical protein NTX73_03665 [Rhodobacterales bacterium]|nr:hypothetical protein [Rhodobacterales bacterium]